MTERYRVSSTNERGPVRHSYPADIESAALVAASGGRSKLSPADAARVRYKTVGPGDDCSDMARETLALFVARGWVVRVVEPDADERELSGGESIAAAVAAAGRMSVHARTEG